MIVSLITTKLLPMFLTAVGFGFLITVHEFGHFIFARLFNIGVPVFSIGFGPSLINKRIGATEFRLSLIPLGGYCAIQGMSDPEAGMVDTHEATLDPAQSFEKKALWQKVLVLLGGIIFNALFAYSAFIGSYWGTHPKLKNTITFSSIVSDSAAEKIGIAAGTTLRGYNDVTFTTKSDLIQEQLDQMLAFIKSHPRAEIDLDITTKDNDKKTVTATIGCTASEQGSLGVGIAITPEPIPGEFEYHSFTVAVNKGIALTNRYISKTVTAIFGIFKNRSLDGMGGPLAIFTQMYQGAKSGLVSFVLFLGNISVSLAVMNLIPLGALDGGQLLFILVEGVIRRPLPDRFKFALIIGSWLLFLGVTIILSYRDIIRMIS